MVPAASSRSLAAAVVSRVDLTANGAHQQPMADRAVAHDQLAFDDFRNKVDLLVRKDNTNAFAYRTCVAADRDKLAVMAGDAHRDVASEAQEAFGA
jgi:hypothetical protein